MSDVFQIADILVDYAMRAHGDEIGIIAYYGSRAKGKATATSDLDIYYIPDEDKASRLSSQFVLGGLPYDFWGVPWDFLEAIVDGRSPRPWAVAASLIADTQVLYHRSPADLERFNGLKHRIDTLTKPESRPEMIRRALAAFRPTLFQLGQLQFAVATGDEPGARWAGRKFIHAAINCLALINQTYFSKGWGANMAQVVALPLRPATLPEQIDTILHAPKLFRLPAAATRLANDVRQILAEAQASVAALETAPAVFKDFYYYIFEYRNKVVGACERGDVSAAGSAAFHLQELICQLLHKTDAGFYGDDFNLLGDYMTKYTQLGFPDLLGPATGGDLSLLAQRALTLDEMMQAWLTAEGIPLNKLANNDALPHFLQERDPV